MSTPINDGGPAFPCESYGLKNGKQTTVPAQGMTLRDYFAAAALQGLMANPGGPIQANGMSGWEFTNCTPDQVANQAVVMADAMLAARKEASK